MTEPRILLTGSRFWSDKDAIRTALLEHINRSLTATGAWPRLVHGGCPTGADAIADEVWADLATRYTELPPAEVHRADWNLHGPAAGPKRNAHMVSLGATVCLAFPLGRSRGTRGCMARAHAAGIPVIDHDPLGQVTA